MQAGPKSEVVIDRANLPSLVATFCSYESLFGPYHPQTLQLLTTLGIAYWQAGELGLALSVLERAVRDLNGNLQRDHHLRLRALAAMKEVSLAQGDHERAGAVQTEIVGCQIDRRGSDHPDTVVARADLAMILLKKIDCVSSRE